MITMKQKGAESVEARLIRTGFVVEAAALKFTRSFGKVMKQRAQSNAPRDTGAYAKTIRLNVTTKSTVGPKATVRSRAPQAHRLEMGWTGPDMWGRFYPMRPQPHLKPALDQTAPEYRAALAAIPFP